MPKFAANLSMLFTEHDFLDRFGAAAAAGFAGVEYLFPYPYPKDALVEQLGRHGLVQVLHNLPAGDWAAGERGIACLPGRIGEFQDGVGQAIDYATALGCRQINCLAGIAPAGVPEAKVRETFIGNLRFAAKALAAHGIALLIEPVNTRDIPGFYLNRTAQALAIIDEVGADNLFLQYDVYHMQIMEGDLVPTIRKHLPRIRHIQIADTPGRHEPGSGEINFPYVLAAIDAASYNGWIGCEYKPAGRTEAGLSWFERYRRSAAPADARLLATELRP
jgi:hydroxypyruvate isomerase